jgi:hypothetical protein
MKTRTKLPEQRRKDKSKKNGRESTKRQQKPIPVLPKIDPSIRIVWTIGTIWRASWWVSDLETDVRRFRRGRRTSARHYASGGAVAHRATGHTVVILFFFGEAGIKFGLD